MIVIPAVDILGGKPVRLLRGEYDRVTQYGDSPLEAARRWREAGATWLHVIDLDGARTGAGANGDAIRAIIQESGLRVQVGGGLRTPEDVGRVLRWGAERAVVGTTAMRDPQLLRVICKTYPSQIVIGLDARAGEVAVQGWTEGSGVGLLDAARMVQAAGASRILFTSIDNDGTFEGPDLKRTEELLSAVHLSVIASGGVGKVEHVEALARTGAEAVVVGRALYEGTVPVDLLRRFDL